MKMNLFRTYLTIFVFISYLTIARSFSLSFKGSRETLQKVPGINPLCLACKTFVSLIQELLANGVSDEDLLTVATDFCKSEELFPDDVCDGQAQLSGPELLYVLNYTEYGSSDVCGYIFGGVYCPEDNIPDWKVSYPGAKPEITLQQLELPATPFKIIHMSDTHIDLKYEEGAWDKCEHPLCCRTWDNDEIPPDAEPGGQWGAKGNCDLPLQTLHRLVEAAAALEPHLVYVTGDLPAHDVWDQTHSSNLAAIDATIDVFKTHFPNTTVIFAMGNHESAPVNSFPMPSTYSSGYDMHWLYDHLADSWTYWVPEETRGSIRAGGYFQYSPIPGLRVVSMNMNFCYRFNWWVILDHVDPVGELQWLVNILEYSETNNEHVHIIGHIPPGSIDCWSKWSHQMNRIITRFESTISGMFFGHHHSDQWEIYWDVDNNVRPVGVGFLPPSGTCRGEKNPSFRMYYVDGVTVNATWAVVDHENYSMNMTIANEDGGEPEFNSIYKATRAYGISSVSPQEMANLTFQMAVDDSLYEEYLRHKYNYFAEPPQLADISDKDKRASRLCILVSGDTSDSEPCDRITDLVYNGPK